MDGHGKRAHPPAPHHYHHPQSQQQSNRTTPLVNKVLAKQPEGPSTSTSSAVGIPYHEVAVVADKPPLPPGPGQGQSCGNNTTNGSNLGTKTVGGGGGHLRLGGISRFLLEKAQSNDSGLDLSPATLQTLVHPLRSSNSSTSSLNGRTLFESPASSDESPQAPHPEPEPSDNSDREFYNYYLPPPNVPSTPQVSRSMLSERSHNGSETTIIEKTLTDDSTSKNTSRRDGLDPIIEGSNNPTVTVLKETTNSTTTTQPYQHQQQRPVSNPDDVTPKDSVFQVPYYGHSHYHQKDKSKTGFSIANNIENNNPVDQANNVVRGDYRSNTYSSSHQNNGFHSTPNNKRPTTDIAAVIPSAAPGPNEVTRKVVQTPKHKSCKKKPPNPVIAKKQTGGWKFLSEHVQDKEFLILEQLGKGGCGEVSMVMEKDTRKQYALKIVQLHGIQEALVQECINEVEMLIDLKETELVVDIHSWEFNRSEKTMKILMEKGQCDLNHTISKTIRSMRPMKMLKIKYIWESLLVIVDKIHSKGIVHADLKPANFVWVDDNLKIIDFGIASRLQNDLTSIAMQNPKGTLNFISPEIIKLDESGRSKLSPKSDIWALGCILYLMVYGRTPFEHISHPVTKMNAIVQGDVMYPHLPPHLQGSEVLSVLKLCFQADYKRRPTAADLLRHPFLRS